MIVKTEYSLSITSETTVFFFSGIFLNFYGYVEFHILWMRDTSFTRCKYFYNNNLYSIFQSEYFRALGIWVWEVARIVIKMNFQFQGKIISIHILQIFCPEYIFICIECTIHTHTHIFDTNFYVAAFIYLPQYQCSIIALPPPSLSLTLILFSISLMALVVYQTLYRHRHRPQWNTSRCGKFQCQIHSFYWEKISSILKQSFKQTYSLTSEWENTACNEYLLFKAAFIPRMKLSLCAFHQNDFPFR